MLAQSPDDTHDLSRAIGVDYLVLRAAGEVCALPVHAISEILRRPKITPVPRAGKAIAGIASVRGAVVTVFDLVEVIDLPRPATKVTGGRVLLIDRGNEKVGLLVDSVIEVVRIEKDSLEHASVLGGEPAPHVLAVARPKGSPIILLNERLLFEGIS